MIEKKVYPSAGLPETVWAAAVPMNYGRRVSDLVHDIYGDHAYLVHLPLLLLWLFRKPSQVHLSCCSSPESLVSGSIRRACSWVSPELVCF